MILPCYLCLKGLLTHIAQNWLHYLVEKVEPNQTSFYKHNSLTDNLEFNEFKNFSLVNPINEFVLIAVLIAVLSKNCFLLYTMCEREKTKQD